jgi:HRAS-like suppressor 3
MSQHEGFEGTDSAFRPDLPIGAHLASKRAGYVHHGIYIGHGRVIHYAGLSRHPGRGPVETTSIEQFSAGSGIEVIPHLHAQYEGFEVVHRAASRLGERNYRLLTNNCEHLCLWCVAGQARSDQVEACIRNPARAVRVLFMLFFCRLVHEWRLASIGRMTEVPVSALNL